jgi:hypothetical protein
MRQVIVALSEGLFRVVLVYELTDGVLKVEDVLALRFLVEGEASEVSELRVVADWLHIVEIFFYYELFLRNFSFEVKNRIHSIQ